MRLSVIESFYPAYLHQFYRKRPWLKDASFAECRLSLLEDRFDASHIFEPIYHHDPNVQFVVYNDKHSQQRWAQENRLRTRNMIEILLTQIEHHRSDVIYALEPSFMTPDVMSRFPGTVKKIIIWHAFPAIANYDGVDLVLSSHKNYLIQASSKGVATGYFTPSHDPEMSRLAYNEFRPIDISFVGIYADTHGRRNRLLQKIADLGNYCRLVFGLMHPKKRPLLNTRFLRRLPSPFPYLPRNLRRVSYGPIFGRDLYGILSHSKIVLNASADVALTPYRGNMRCYEAMGCGACLVSDEGMYPNGMIDNETFISFTDEEDAVRKIKELLQDPGRCRSIGRKAADMIETNYSKSAQWSRFKELVSNLG